jgi:hypothetical protein
MHDLVEAQKLPGRLQHATFIIPQGSPYLWALYNFVGVYSALKPDGSFAHSPKKLLTSSMHCRGEVDWWINQLSRPRVGHRLGYPVHVLDIGAFSDASGALGIGVVIRAEWCAWKFNKLWKRNNWDIQWVEAIGFELACQDVFARLPTGCHVCFWCNNISIVDGWQKDCSQNCQVNDIFKHLHAFLNSMGGAAYPCYVASAKIQPTVPHISTSQSLAAPVPCLPFPLAQALMVLSSTLTPLLQTTPAVKHPHASQNLSTVRRG